MLWNFRVDKTELTWVFVNIAISHGSALRGESFPRELERFSVSFCELVGQFWLVYIMVMLKKRVIFDTILGTPDAMEFTKRCAQSNRFEMYINLDTKIFI